LLLVLLLAGDGIGLDDLERRSQALTGHERDADPPDEDRHDDHLGEELRDLPEADEPGEPADDADEATSSVAGHHHGFEVPAGETWEIEGEVTTDANVVVHGTLRMRAGSNLTFVDVDETAFEGGGMDVLDTDVGLWVMGSGRLDVQGTPVQGWNRTGAHETWREDHDYVIAPHDPPRRANASAWQLGDPVPCSTFAEGEYCAEVANLTRDVTIQGTPEGRAHIFIRSDRPQTLRYVELRHLGPMIDDDEPDGRYGLHFHHSGDGSRGSIVEGTVARDMGDHAYTPHESHGITFRDTVAYDVVDTPYWWDPGDQSDDIHYDRALALEVHEGGRDSPSNTLVGFRLGKGEGNKVTASVAAAVRGAGGYLWREGSPNEWVFEDNVAHHTSAGILFWVNEHRHADKQHEVGRYVGYRNSQGILHGAYQNRVDFDELILFDNSHHAIAQRAAPRGDTSVVPGTVYRNGTLSGGYDTRQVIDVSARRNCDHPDATGQHTLYENLWLVDFDGPPITIDQDRDECRHDGDRMHIVFRDIVVGEARRPLQRDDIHVENIPQDALIEVEHDGEQRFTIERE
jgi:hypothetical protein